MCDPFKHPLICEENCSLKPVNGNGYNKSNYFEYPLYYNVSDMSNLENNAHVIVHSLSSGKVEMFLCATCHAYTPHVNAWKR